MTLYDFLGGAVAMGFIVSALFFLRFWRRTREGLFLSFATAFVLLAIGQCVVALGSIPNESRGSIYLIRLAAFMLILLGIGRANNGRRRSSAMSALHPNRR